MKLRQKAYCWQGIAIRNTAHFAIATSTLLFSHAVGSQIIPDNSLTVNSIVTPNGNTLTIEGGSRAGGNLFHSFKEFSLPTGGEAFFNNAVDVQNIFSRITGSNISNIDGLIRANGTANLFLLNPNGIIFGPNARLNIGGSFIGSTANSINFADGTQFSAKNPSASPLLTVSVPIGLQFGQNSGSITVRGSGHRITEGLFIPLDRSNNPIGLQVKAGDALALIGSGVNFVGGIAAADGGGHLEVGSVSDGLVRLYLTRAGSIADYSAVQQFNDIHLAQQSLLDASGRQGSIRLQGRNISLTEASFALIQDFGTQPSGGITVRATESLSLSGNTPDGGLGSEFRIDNFGVSPAGDITIKAAQFSLKDGGQIRNTAYSPAPSGNLTIDVPGSIYIEGFAPTNPIRLSSLSTSTWVAGKAGDLTISSGNLRLLDGAAISSATLGSGKAGTVRINTQGSLEIVGNNPITLVPSGISSTTVGSGNADNLLVNTSRLVIQDGGFLGSSTGATGSAGSATIDASQSVEVIGRATGSSATSRIVSTAEILDPASQAAFRLPPIPTGNAGSLTINTPSLRITDGAVTVKNDGPGIAGELQINANSILLENRSRITASTASGNGGNINLKAGSRLIVRNNSQIDAESFGTGNGGNISIDSPTLVGLENSDINANAVQGNGGNIQIRTQGIFGIQYRLEQTQESDITASSQFGLSGTVAITNPEVETRSLLVELPQNLIDTSGQITSGCDPTQGNTFTIAGRGGLPENPTSGLLGRAIWWDNRDLSTPDQTASLPAQNVTTSEPTPEIVEATGWVINAQGQVELVAQKPNRIPGYNAPNCRPIVAN
ncbi:MAG TPA: filamentous hemagglutinin [Cyanobacteria bacterium UBA11369]|nr:filamentous hemagglutinin [Cyanobacteria bacterium UBA11371]HBE35896.1 filamentous hemagglutinin [Cyanobacteria bacterium UBA11368]HBE51226.1 filamentous hemagglutinin [Cyanobacteria bacterium UBA11369]